MHEEIKSGFNDSDSFERIKIRDDQGTIDDLNWRIKVPIINNALYLKELGILFGGTVLVFTAIISIIFAISPPYGGDYFGAVAQVALIGLGIGFGLVIISFLILTLICRGGLDTSFHIGKDGVRYEIKDKRYKKMNRAILLLSLLGDSNAAITTTGAALIAMSRESEFIGWSAVRNITIYGKGRIIYFRRKSLVKPIPVFCSPENFDDAVMLVKKYAQGIKINVK